MVVAYTGRGSKILKISLAKSAVVVATAGAVSDGVGEEKESAAELSGEADVCDNPAI